MYIRSPRRTPYTGTKPFFNPTQLNIDSIKNIYSFTSNDIIDRYYTDPDKLLIDIMHGDIDSEEIVRLLNYLPDENTWFTDHIIMMIDPILIFKSGNWNMIEKALPFMNKKLEFINTINAVIPTGQTDIVKRLVELCFNGGRYSC